MKIGLALGGGGARGLAHLGVWQRLDELGVPIHCIAGTSIGAIAGAIIAAGRIQEALAWCAQPDWKKLPPLMFGNRLSSKALMQGRRVETLIARLIGVQTFDELSLPFAAVATDFHTGEPVVMREGNLLSAVRGSMSIPGVFRPVERDGHILIDGQLVDPVPVAACRAMGADTVIAVDINPPSAAVTTKPWSKVNIFDVLVGTISIFNLAMTRHALSLNRPDVLIRPEVGDIWTLDFRHAERLVALGRDAVDVAVKKLTNKKSPSYPCPK